MIKIHDIKPIVEIPDYSIFFYYTIIGICFLLFCLFFYLLYRFFKPRNKTQEMKWYEILSNLDFNDTKNTAYKITKYGTYLATDERQKRLIEELTNELSNYKYKKEIQNSFSSNIKTKFSIFMDTLDVK